MLVNQTSVSFTLTKPLHSISLFSQYLSYEVVIRIVIRRVKRQTLTALRPAFNCLRLLACCALAGLLLLANTSHAADKELQQKSAALSIELIELLGELGDDEADLDAAMSSVESNQIAKKLPQTKPIATENSNTGAKK